MFFIIYNIKKKKKKKEGRNGKQTAAKLLHVVRSSLTSVKNINSWWAPKTYASELSNPAVLLAPSSHLHLFLSFFLFFFFLEILHYSQDKRETTQKMMKLRRIPEHPDSILLKTILILFTKINIYTIHFIRHTRPRRTAEFRIQ